MSFTQSMIAPRRLSALVALVVLACASPGGSGDGASSPDREQDQVDCTSLPACGKGLQCSGGAQCFKLESCPGFVCASTKVACQSECRDGADCLVLESHPMMLSCR